MSNPKNDNASAGTVASVFDASTRNYSTPTHATRQAAFEQSRFGQQSYAKTIMRLITEKGALGLSDDEGQQQTGIPVQSWTPARHKLASSGMIMPLPGVTRQTRLGRKAVVWVLPQYAPKQPHPTEPGLFNGGAA